jgi:hypothetical protein
MNGDPGIGVIGDIPGGGYPGCTNMPRPGGGGILIPFGDCIGILVGAANPLNPLDSGGGGGYMARPPFVG